MTDQTTETTETTEATTPTLDTEVERLFALREQVKEAETEFSEANEHAKSLRKAWEARRDEFEAAVDALEKRLHGVVEDLPLFNQSDQLAADEDAALTPDALFALYREVDPESDVTRETIATWSREERVKSREFLESLKAEHEAEAEADAEDEIDFGDEDAVISERKVS